MDHEKFLGSTREEIAGHKAEGAFRFAIFRRVRLPPLRQVFSKRIVPLWWLHRGCHRVRQPQWHPITVCRAASCVEMRSEVRLDSKVTKVIADCAEAVHSLSGCPDCK